ncbi:hypothetical protein C8T65DRAFT_823108, partial [Cerioporus squamosus]
CLCLCSTGLLGTVQSLSKGRTRVSARAQSSGVVGDADPSNSSPQGIENLDVRQSGNARQTSGGSSSAHLGGCFCPEPSDTQHPLTPTGYQPKYIHPPSRTYASGWTGRYSIPLSRVSRLQASAGLLTRCSARSSSRWTSSRGSA